jgi:hypothetical protein
LTVKEPSLVNLLISICHCLKAMVGSMMSVDALIDVCRGVRWHRMRQKDVKPIEKEKNTVFLCYS